MALTAHQKSLEIAVVHGASVPARVRIDPHRVRQVLVNLLGNAVKFTERGSVTLRTQLVARPGEPRPVIEFSVEDTGVGIASSRLAAIFDPFTQADGSTSRRFGGTGLGLTISSRLVHLMGGSISVESEEGRGSAFRVALPAEAAAASATSAAICGELAGLRVLVVDDSAPARSALVALLSRLEASPVAAASGAEALQILEAACGGEAFDAVVIDFDMPQRSGLDVLHDAHRRGVIVPPAVLTVTASDLSAAVAHPHATHATAHVHKPVRRQDLAHAIHRAREARAESQGQSHARRASVDPQVAVAAGAHIRVLLVEDNPVNQMVAAALLERRGIDVVVAGNGREGVETFRRQPFDLVLMDIQMPEMDGFEALAAIRTLEQGTGRHTPVVALTAHAMKEDRDRCLAAGMDAHLSKPLEATKLYEIIGGVLDRPLTPA
jgi:CheY-like chemotaxis protein